MNKHRKKPPKRRKSDKIQLLTYNIKTEKPLKKLDYKQIKLLKVKIGRVILLFEIINLNKNSQYILFKLTQIDDH